MPAWPAVAAGLLAMASGPAWAVPGASADLHLALRWCASAPTTRVEVAWTNTGATALALWPLTDTDTGPQHDALRIENGAWSAPLIAPRKHAAARWCGLAPGQRVALVIDLAAWHQRLLAPGRPGRAWVMAYQVAPDPVGLPAPWPACLGGMAAAPLWAATWTGRLAGPIQAAHAPAKRSDRPGDPGFASAC